MSKLLFIDTETTSSDKYNAGVFQISGIIDIDGRNVREFNIFSDIFPNDPVEEQAFEKNGMTLEKIHMFQPPLKAFSEFCNILRKYVGQYDKQDKFVVLGYFADYDNCVLRHWFDQNCNKYFGSFFWHPWIDIANLAMYLYQDVRPTIKSFKLEDMARFNGIEVDSDKCHDSLYDIKITRKLYYELIKG